MNRVLPAIVLAFSSLQVATPASAAEGHVSDPIAPALDSSRVSKYTPDTKGTLTAPALKPGTPAPKQHLNPARGKLSPTRTKRSSALSLFSHASGFHFYDAGSTLLSDRDEDGHYSEFKIRFDADTSFGDVRVYAKLYLRRVGDADWVLYHTTEDFWIYNQAGDDDYFVTTTLDDGFPTGDYDILIDLFESGHTDIVATIGPDESGALSGLPLEEAGLDVPIELPGYSIGEVTTTLLTDTDGDGHYSRFRIAFDPDADFDGTFVYAKVWARPQGGAWIQEHVSADFLVDASGTADTYSFTAEWISGYPTANYDVQIDLHDAATDALVASAGSERPELSRVPLEDQSRDRSANTPDNGGSGGSTTSREHGGGGAMALWWMFGLLVLVIGRRVGR